jgi:DNA-binding HxlR family transcriptional regulator
MSQVRPGSFALSLLSVPLNVQVLEGLEEGPKSLGDLRHLAGAPAPTTMRKQLRILTDLEVVIRRQQAEFPGGVEYELRQAGTELLEVRDLLRDWLADAPQEPTALSSAVARSVVKALVQGWDSKIIRAIAARPRSLTDLNGLITSLNYPSLERRFSALRACGLIEPRPGEGRGTPYGPSAWLRRACGPLAAAAHWERRHAVDEVDGLRFDFEAVFLLAALGRSLSEEVSGRCRLGVELRNGSGEVAMAGVQLRVVEGQVLSCMGRPEGEADASASGSSVAWVQALVSGRPDDLYLSGDRHLAREVVDGLHGEILGLRAAA